MPYYRGDYYRGDYYSRFRGDPGLFGSLGRLVGGAARAVGGIAKKIPGVGGIVGTVLETGGGLISRIAGPGGGAAAVPAIAPPGGGLMPSLIPGRGVAPRKVGKMTVGISPYGTKGIKIAGGGGRRMNPGNAKAARRAIRRIKSVRHLLQSIERQLPHRKARPRVEVHRR